MTKRFKRNAKNERLILDVRRLALNISTAINYELQRRDNAVTIPETLVEQIKRYRKGIDRRLDELKEIIKWTDDNE